MSVRIAYSYWLDRHAHPSRRSAISLGLTDVGIVSLGRGNALVFDGMLTAQVAGVVRLVVLEMERSGALRPAGMGAKAVLDPSVRGDSFAWLDLETLPVGLVPVTRLFEELMLGLNESAYLGARTLECQVAVYRRGRGYARHRDATTAASSRRATAIYYANPWQSGDGGELEVWEATGSRMLAPVADRLVVFRSQCTEHAVHPVLGGPRVAVSAFMRN